MFLTDKIAKVQGVKKMSGKKKLLTDFLMVYLIFLHF